ncbi:MAG TPA: alanine dehydrogenase [Actinomycetota bacterium]
MRFGFPRMHKEAGERRDFLPGLVDKLADAGADVAVEAGIGSGMGLTDLDYTSRSTRIRVIGNAEAFAQDVVVTLRAPETEEFEKLRRGAVLVSMLHFPTRPARVARLRGLGIDAIALDVIADDDGGRLVVNSGAVAWNGLEAAFDVLEATWTAFADPGRPPAQALITGAGAIGRHAVEAATKFGNGERRDRLMRAGVPGIVVRTVGRNVTGDATVMRSLLAETDVLVDASQRSDPSRPLIPNAWVGSLPSHAIVCDLVVDPYLTDPAQLATHPPTVRSIEGIPRGNLDKYVFRPDDPDWCDTIPPDVPTAERRTTVTCYSWPGVRPLPCMELYGMQLEPLLLALLERGGVGRLRADGSFHERALRRGALRHWEG